MLTLSFSSDSFLSENPIVAKIQYGMKITFIFILILFIDSVNRVYRVQVELASATDSAKGAYVYPSPLLFPVPLTKLFLTSPAGPP